jgi:hypothetical protein
MHIATASSLLAAIAREASGMTTSIIPGLTQTLDGCGPSSVSEECLREVGRFMSSGQADVGRRYTAMLR